MGYAIAGFIAFLFFRFIGNGVGVGATGHFDPPNGSDPGSNNCADAKKERDKQIKTVQYLEKKVKALEETMKNAKIVLGVAIAAAAIAVAAALATGWLLWFLYGLAAAATAAAATAGGVLEVATTQWQIGNALLAAEKRNLKADEALVKKLCP